MALLGEVKRVEITFGIMVRPDEVMAVESD